MTHYLLTPSEFLQGILPTHILPPPRVGEGTGGGNPLPSKGVVTFDIRGPDGGCWTADFARGTVTTGAPQSTQAIFRATSADFVAYLEGRMSPEDGLLCGRLSIAGEWTLARRLLASLPAVARAAGDSLAINAHF